MKKCFVISPIGEEGSEVREHADDVFDYIITPALEECGIRPIRSDHLSEPGLISSQMFDAIINYDMCIAVLTFKNPNVYYELAIAQAANQPVIILLQKGEILPFDIKDLRCVYYDLKPRSLFEKVYSMQIIEFIKVLRNADWKVAIKIPGLSTTKLQEETTYYEMSQNYGSHIDWGNLLNFAQNKFEIMGISLNAWRRVKDFSETLLKKSAEGCNIRILLMHKDNPSLSKMINPNITEMSYDEISLNIEKNYDWFSNLSKESENIEVRQIRNGMPFHTQYINDEFGIYIPYFFSETTGYTPLWKANNGTHIYKLLLKEFDILWSINNS